MEDTIDLAREFESIKDKIPVNVTHLVMTLPSRRNAGMWRMKDGMFIGEAADKMVIYGENPNKRESRLFIAHKWAKAFLHTVATEDLEDGLELRIFEHNQEENNLIALPGGDSSLIVNGSVPSVKRFN